MYLGPFPVGRTCSRASLVPLGMKWACICAGKKNVLGVVWCLSPFMHFPRDGKKRAASLDGVRHDESS